MADNIREIENLYESRVELKKLEKRFEALLNLFKLAMENPEMLEVIEKLYRQIKNPKEINIGEIK